MTEKITEFTQLCELASKKRLLKKLVFSKLAVKQIKKAVIEPKTHAGRLIFVLEHYMQDGKKTQKNHEQFPSDAVNELLCSCMQANLIFDGEECEYKASKKGNATIIGKNKLLGADAADTSASASPLNREKNYILDGSEAFLCELGITDKNGRIKDKRQAKFRQICRFLEYVRDMLPNLPDDRIVVYDLCCGKS